MDPMVGFLATYSYDTLSRRTTLTNGNGRYTMYDYAPDSALEGPPATKINAVSPDPL